MGFIINHKFVIGAAGYALTSDISGLAVKVDDSSNYKFFYGGLLLKYIISSHSLIHFTAHGLLGAGVFQQENTYEQSYYSYRGRHRSAYSVAFESSNKDLFYVFEPGADVMLNVHKNIRVGVGVTYRFIRDFDYDVLSGSNMDGYTVQAKLKLGSF